ncbi:MAG: formylglycine-generating enzyme family protein [Opitutales bacterium]
MKAIGKWAVMINHIGRLAAELPIFGLLALLAASTMGTALRASVVIGAPEGMVLIPGGRFSMGGDAGLMDGGSQSHGTAYPIHTVELDAFWMDRTEVTNRQFAEFVAATGYVTFAERPLPAETVAQFRSAIEANIQRLYQQISHASAAVAAKIRAEIVQLEQMLEGGHRAGSIIFDRPIEGLANASDIHQWWRLEGAANWRAPEGLGSDWRERLDHPVVNVTPEDAAAYAQWRGKRLPTEAEWERAARGGLERQPFVWGELFAPQGVDVWMANIWQGPWPYQNTRLDGFQLTAPVASFPPNDFGLYDMAGNVWEIVADRYHPEAYALRADHIVNNPQGPDGKLLARLRQRVPTYVTRGGSFLCSDAWCSGYQPGSRQPHENDSPAHHTGFRCAMDVQQSAP